MFAGLIDDFELTDVPCLTWTRLGSTAWLISKCILYCLLILRLHTIYKETVYAYNPKLLLIVAIIIIMESLTMTVLIPATTTVSISYHNGIRICDGHIYILYLGIVVLVDFIVSILCLYLFLYPLNILLKTQRRYHFESFRSQQTLQSSSTLTFQATTNDSSNNGKNHSSQSTSVDTFDIHRQKRDRDFEALMIRVSTLTVTMILSTLISLIIVAISNVQTLAVIDSAVNCVCVLFFNKQYKKWFAILCYGAVGFTKLFTSICCCGCCDREESDSNQVNLGDVPKKNATCSDVEEQ